MLRLITVILVLSVSVVTSHAQQQHLSTREKLVETGGAFLKTCSVVEKPTKTLSSTELLDANYCAAYIAGFVDALQVTAELYQEAVACFPEGEIDLRQATKMVLAYIREKPERRERTTAVLVGAALARAYPCRK